MNLWHLTSDAARIPHLVHGGETVQLVVGTWPIEPGQRVWIEYEIEPLGGPVRTNRSDATWWANRGVNSYWESSIGPFQFGDRVRYTIFGASPAGTVLYPTQEFQVRRKLYLAIVWHQHQPIYKDASGAQRGSYAQPWVRLHAVRDYYAMADLVRQHPTVHLTINLTPSLLWQIDDYVHHGATDRALELTLKPANELTDAEREYVLSNFFDAHWHNQIFPHPRYKELFEQRYNAERFTERDLRDLQMWFNLAWFAKEFRERDVRLVTGEVVSVRKFIDKDRDFDQKDIREMVECQYTILRAVVPLHRQMQDDAQIEISTTPFFHPILPLLMDTDRATVDRPGAALPSRFSWPEDAEAQVQLGVEAYTRWFGRAPRGMWPAEGAVSQSIIPVFGLHGIHWIASDEGVLARSGEYGYRVEDPGILCQPYRAEETGHAISILFRSRSLSDTVGFDYHGYADYHDAATDFLNRIRQNFSEVVRNDSDHVLTVILDGENAWGDYRDDARPFLHSLYSLLEDAADIHCVTPSDYLAAHPIQDQAKVYNLFTGSWIDRWGSRPGVDLDTWIGEEEKNTAWELLGKARRDIGGVPDDAGKQILALQHVYAAEGSDWFWWFGSDHESGHHEQFDELFRTHLKNAYTAVGKTAPPALDQHIAPHTVTWTFANQTRHVQPHDRLAIQTNCPGILTWNLDYMPETSQPLNPASGAMAAVQYYHFTLGPFPPTSTQIAFRFHCTHDPCSCDEICCEGRLFIIEISAPAGALV